MKRPTKHETEAVSDNPRRFRRCLEQAGEVRVFALNHHGELPDWCWKLTDGEWDELSSTLREIDSLQWLRAVAA